MKSKKKVGIIDYGAGNLGSIFNAIQYLDSKVEILVSPLNLKKYSHLILPGVGSFGRLANNLNFGALGKATELRQRLLFTLGALIVFRLGTFLPIPGINPIALQQFFEQQSSGILGIFDTFSGGALGRMGIFALGVMPYISASIIMTLMQSAIPYLKSLKEKTM